MIVLDYAKFVKIVREPILPGSEVTVQHFDGLSDQDYLRLLPNLQVKMTN